VRGPEEALDNIVNACQLCSAVKCLTGGEISKTTSLYNPLATTSLYNPLATT